jgi:hypothetical protein
MRIRPAPPARPLLALALLLAPAAALAPIMALAPITALAQPRPAPAQPASRPEAPQAGPKSIGVFQDWQAATHAEAGQTVCYALSRAKPAGALPGRGEVVLTVTHRANLRDAVAIGAGFAYAANAEVKVEAGQATLDFYTHQRSAFARDGARAVAAFGRAQQAIARSPGPRGPIADTFSLRGFAQAYAAIGKACPPR